MKIVINRCFGGFGLSEAAKVRYCQLKNLRPEALIVSYIGRADPDLVLLVEELGELANGSCSYLKIVEGPNGVEDEDWFIKDFDGKEKVVTYAREWY